jgi:acyl carrier protein
MAEPTISSRTPEGDGYLCPICGKMAALEASSGSRDVPCPSCGHLLWWIRDRLGITGDLLETLRWARDEIGEDSLDLVELVMELEEEFEVTIPDHEAENCRTIEDLIRLIQRYRHHEGE